jgi:hypothetical protein
MSAHDHGNDNALEHVSSFVSVIVHEDPSSIRVRVDSWTGDLAAFKFSDLDLTEIVFHDHDVREIYEGVSVYDCNIHGGRNSFDAASMARR